MNTDKPTKEESSGLLHAGLTDQIIGAFYEVYNELGHGFLESVYEEALLKALRDAGLSVEQQRPISVRFRGAVVGNFFADLLVENTVILELKTARAIDSTHEAQLLNYLKATDKEVGLILNFGSKPQFRRLRLDNHLKKIRVNPCESVVDAVGVIAR